jgi:hypothetical protein
MSPKQTCLEHVLVVGAVAVWARVQVEFQHSVLRVEEEEEEEETSEVLPPKAVGVGAGVLVEFQHSVLRWEGVEGAGLLVRVEMLTVAAGRDPEVCPATVPIAGGSSL